MKTYILDIIPQIKQFSKKLDIITVLTNQHWVVLDEISKSKSVYIFRSNNELLISQNGKVKRARWEYLGHKSLLIDIGEETYLFKHDFYDANILALKVDGKNEYAVLVNESKYDGELNSLEQVKGFLFRYYLDYNIYSKEVDGEVKLKKGLKEESGSIVTHNGVFSMGNRIDDIDYSPVTIFLIVISLIAIIVATAYYLN
jgi:hypothetical protein